MPFHGIQSLHQRLAEQQLMYHAKTRWRSMPCTTPCHALRHAMHYAMPCHPMSHAMPCPCHSLDLSFSVVHATVGCSLIYCICSQRSALLPWHTVSCITTMAYNMLVIQVCIYMVGLCDDVSQVSSCTWLSGCGRWVARGSCESF